MIHVKSLYKRFSEQMVLNDINLNVPEGSVCALIGPSGSGKSTLLRCINLLEIPSSGEVRVAEESWTFNESDKISINNVRRIRRNTGMIFQNFQLFPHMSVIENVMEGLVTVLKWPVAEAKERALVLLTKVGMRNKANEWPGNLSGGQQQRVAIARALATSPKVLLCDEPTSALDPELSLEVVDVLRKLAKEDGVTMLMATHDLRLAASLADQAVFIESGSIIEKGSAQEIFSAPKMERTANFVSTLTGISIYSWEI